MIAMQQRRYMGSLEHGFAEECGCIFCKNFAAQRNLVYPASFRTLLEQLGIDPNKEGEAFEYGPVKDGCHLYGGWFHFVGQLYGIKANDPWIGAISITVLIVVASVAGWIPARRASRIDPVLALRYE